MVREGTREILEREPDLCVVAEAGDGRETVELVEREHPDVVVLDISMPVMNGIEATKGIKQVWPRTAVLVLTAYDDDEYVFAILEAGAAGSLLNARGSGLIEAVRMVHAGESVLHPSIAKKVVRRVTHGDAPDEERLGAAHRPRTGGSAAGGAGTERPPGCREPGGEPTHGAIAYGQHLWQVAGGLAHRSGDGGAAPPLDHPRSGGRLTPLSPSWPSDRGRWADPPGVPQRYRHRRPRARRTGRQEHIPSTSLRGPGFCYRRPVRRALGRLCRYRCGTPGHVPTALDRWATMAEASASAGSSVIQRRRSPTITASVRQPTCNLPRCWPYAIAPCVGSPPGSRQYGGCSVPAPPAAEPPVRGR